MSSFLNTLSLFSISLLHPLMRSMSPDHLARLPASASGVFFMSLHRSEKILTSILSSAERACGAAVQKSIDDLRYDLLASCSWNASSRRAEGSLVFDWAAYRATWVSKLRCACSRTLR